jgi:acetyl esterase/lipase
MSGPIRRAYGPHPAQIGDFYAGHRPTAVVVVHGGFWRAHRTLDMTAPLAEGLSRRGWNVWNIEYRRAGQAGWRGTLADCAAAIDHLGVLGLGTALVLGHSAGGQLAAWSARHVRVAGVVSLAGVLDLDRAARAGTGEHAVAGFLGGGPDEVPDRYRQADPLARLPTGVPVRCLHSPDDERVPFEQSRRYVEAATRAGDDAALVEIEGAHADGIDLRTAAGQRVVEVLEAIDRRRQYREAEVCIRPLPRSRRSCGTG